MRLQISALQNPAEHGKGNPGGVEIKRDLIKYEEEAGKDRQTKADELQNFSGKKPLFIVEETDHGPLHLLRPGEFSVLAVGICKVFLFKSEP